MSTVLYLIIGFVAGAAIALALYIMVRKSIQKGKRDEIIEKAEIEGEKIKNEKILQAKEKFLSLKAEHDKMIGERNNQIREAESRIKTAEQALNANGASMIDDTVTEDDIAEVVSRWTGIPVTKMQQSERDKLLHL